MLKFLKHFMLFVLIFSLVFALVACGGGSYGDDDDEDEDDDETKATVESNDPPTTTTPESTPESTPPESTTTPSDTDKDPDAVGCAHEFGAWETNPLIPVCSVGYKTRTCSLCSYVELDIVAPQEHMLIAGAVESATDSEIVARFRCQHCSIMLQKVLTPTADEDGDSITNALEITIGTNPFSADTDGDGINDYREISETNTSPVLADTDNDGLTDLNEIEVYLTSPVVADSDYDGVVDGKEVEMGFDPLSYDYSFNLSYTPQFGEDEDTSVIPSINAELTPDQLNSLTIERDNSISKDSLGYIGDAFKFSANNDAIDDNFSMEIGFEFDQSALNSLAQPTIYAIEKNEYGIASMTPIDTNVYGNKATALVDKFTTYVLVDRTVLENDLTWIDTYSIDKNYEFLEIVFVMDDSGSMSWNDSYNQRLSVARDLIDNLPANAKMAVVRFEDSYDYSVLTGGLITDKQTAKNYLSTNFFYASGGTDMYDAIDRSFDIFEATDNNTMRMMVVLTDGDAADTYYHNSGIDEAVDRGINIYTIGLGSSSSSYFYSYLEPLASGTNGEFFYVDNASDLASAFNAIGEKISLTTDSDGDGLSDYYEENTSIFSGISYNLDKDNPDTDGDGLLDGEEIVTTIIYSTDKTMMSITGVVVSNPSMQDSDGDGILDKYDPNPMVAN